MDRRNQSYLIMVVLIVLMIALAVVFALVDSVGEFRMPSSAASSEAERGGANSAAPENAAAEKGGKGSFPWIVFLPISSGIFIPFIARKQAALKLRGTRRSRAATAAILILVTVIFLASVSYIVLRAY